MARTLTLNTKKLGGASRPVLPIPRPSSPLSNLTSSRGRSKRRRSSDELPLPPGPFCKMCLKGHKALEPCPQRRRVRSKLSIPISSSPISKTPLRQSQTVLQDDTETLTEAVYCPPTPRPILATSNEDQTPRYAPVPIRAPAEGSMDRGLNEIDHYAWLDSEWNLHSRRLAAIENLDNNYMATDLEGLQTTFDDESLEPDYKGNYLGLSHPDEWVREHAQSRYEYAVGRDRQVDRLRAEVAEKDRALMAKEWEVRDLRQMVEGMKRPLRS